MLLHLLPQPLHILQVTCHKSTHGVLVSDAVAVQGTQLRPGRIKMEKVISSAGNSGDVWIIVQNMSKVYSFES